MTQFLLRGLFIVVGAAVAALYAVRTFVQPGDSWKLVVTVLGATALCAAIVLWDARTPRKRLSALSGVFLGLIVGMLAAYALSFLVDYAQVVVAQRMHAEGDGVGMQTLFQGIKVFIGVICVFGAITVILQTKDDFRFVIPYVEFAKQIRGPRPMALDTSAIIDGRILDVSNIGVLSGLLIVPRFVLDELQTVADSSDKLKRARGRRGLDVLTKLQNSTVVDVSIEERDAEGETVDQKLVALSQDLHARLVTTDYNLVKIAEVRGVDVINVNDLAEAMRPVVLPGERLSVQVIKPGESPGQGVGYLDDGTMVVVEGGASQRGQTVAVTVTSVLQTSAGRMIFGNLDRETEDSRQRTEHHNEPSDHRGAGGGRQSQAPGRGSQRATRRS
jgi:uncharacterized protein YacL